MQCEGNGCEKVKLGVDSANVVWDSKERLCVDCLTEIMEKQQELEDFNELRQRNQRNRFDRWCNDLLDEQGGEDA